MCGIAGHVRWEGRLPDEAGVGARMAHTLRHRGPDDLGLHEDTWASLGHARLSIIDLEGSHQPLTNEDGSIWVVFNGEIYNFRQLRSELESRGHRLRTEGDTEVIVHLYEEYGPQFVHRLNGMFAIALWDSREHTLLLVRDRLGVKPLYWHDDGQRVVFGSELKALLAAGDRTFEIDPCAIVDYLTFGHIPAPRTIYRNVHKLEPGHLAICRERGVEIARYWDIPPALVDLHHASHRADADYIEQLSSLLEDSVGLRTNADVPLGAFLSGGLDSAAVVTAMTRGQSPKMVSTHTVGFLEDEHDERLAARETAEQLGTTHHEVMVEVSAVEAASRLAWHFDEPFADSSAVPTYYLSRATREQVTVALSGDGADELLGGYRRYRFDLGEDRWRRRLPRSLRDVAGWTGELYPKADWLPRPLRAKTTLQNIACDPIVAHLRSTSLRCGRLPHELMSTEFLRDTSHYSPFDRPLSMARAYRSDHLLGRLLYLDAKTLLPDDMLTKVDRASMAVGLEVREPLLDYRLVEMIATLPPSLRLNKSGLRGVLRKWSHPDLADRPKKGFTIPTDTWFRGPLRNMTHDLLATSRSQISNWLRPEAIRSVLARHDRGFRHEGDVLWTLLSLELWTRQWRGASRGDSAKTMTPQVANRQEVAV